MILIDMIEVEIRGPLTKEEAQKFKEFLRLNGAHIESQDREMILLFDYPGYADDPNKREVDIRLRCTNGKSEIMVKKKLHAHNAGRSEYSVPVASMDEAKILASAFGCSRGLWMHRKKDVYRVNGTEWSVAEALSDDGGKQIFYFETEREASSKEDIEIIRHELVKEAGVHNLSVFTPDEYHEFVNLLGREVNKKIQW